MRDLIITVVILLIVFGIDLFFKWASHKIRKSKPSIPKTVMKPKVVTTPTRHNNEFAEATLEKNAANVPKKANDISYKTEKKTSESSLQEEENMPTDTVQISDSEYANKYLLTFDDAEIYKGFIYSEILQRKYK